MNINFALKLKLITLVFLVAIGSSCLAGESIKSKRKVIEFNQNTLISEINKDKHKFKRIYEYLVDRDNAGLCVLLSSYVAYYRLLNEENVAQISNNEVILSNLQTILRIVESDKKKLKFTIYPIEEQVKIADKISLLIGEYIQAMSNKESRLAADTFNKFDEVVVTWWNEMYEKNQIPYSIGVMVNCAILSPHSIFDPLLIPWILSKDSSGLLTVNEEFFRHTMKEVKIGTYIDFAVVNIGETFWQRSIMLIAKNGDDNFAFFDPGRGIALNLTLSELLWLVNDTLKFLKENMFNKAGAMGVLFNDNTKAAERIARKFAISSIASHFLGLRFYLS
ncbi:hypothetical protein [Candidatus Mesenet endosymbiont of Phosphuga atrata]|uniref:hypothetical protein n=1 Tax=Candidatus Mesenet endosymbiont of Phosphuga atrata TaxID=3066221 RepID=UPI0030CBF86E